MPAICRGLANSTRKWYNTYATNRGGYAGLKYMLDIGLYRLDQQVACQRYRQNFLIAKATQKTAMNWLDQVNDTLASRQLALAPAA
jgi:hypothetical protein